MKIRLIASALTVGVSVAVTALFAYAQTAPDATSSKSRYLPEYTADGDLILPKNFHEWVYVGSPLTPNGLNGGHANFPEFHNVYIEPGSYQIYKKTGVFPKEQFSSRNCNWLFPGNIPMGRERSPLGAVTSPVPSTVPT